MLDTPGYVLMFTTTFGGGEQLLMNAFLNPDFTGPIVGATAGGGALGSSQALGLGLLGARSIRFQLASGSIDYILDDIEITAIPEPATMFLLLAGLLGVSAARRQR